MGIYSEEEAKIEAGRLAQIALQQGLLGPSTPSDFGHPDEAGKRYAQFVGGFIKELAKQLESL